ncbi:RNA polymerase sigma factor [Microbacterium sp. NIBRBAC000506063]|uniref:RNA polymerase sigma factor n=1 Tax=Microbacterium sp. NIBRBAC000506063 TaxID=2734618 RepID=UPI001CB6ECE5|nr:sigma-70 family RNA polymerase sigma factor [Microbacterium sp. NIBRBAC000506063]
MDVITMGIMSEAATDGAARWERAAEHFSAWREGRNSAMDELVRLMTPVLWHVVRAYGLDRTLAEDVVQSTWLILVRRHETITEPRAISGWLTTTARREAWRVAKGHSRMTAIEDEHLEPLLPTEESAEERAATSDERSRLWARCRPCPNAAGASCASSPSRIVPTTPGSRRICPCRSAASGRPDSAASPSSARRSPRPDSPREVRDGRALRRRRPLRPAARAVGRGGSAAGRSHRPHGRRRGLRRSVPGVRAAHPRRGGDHPVRSDNDTATLQFSDGTTSILLHVSDAGGDRRRIDGWTDAEAVEVHLIQGDRDASTAPGEHGRFAFEDVAPGSAACAW